MLLLLFCCCFKIRLYKFYNKLNKCVLKRFLRWCGENVSEQNVFKYLGYFSHVDITSNLFNDRPIWSSVIASFGCVN